MISYYKHFIFRKKISINFKMMMMKMMGFPMGSMPVRKSFDLVKKSSQEAVTESLQAGGTAQVQHGDRGQGGAGRPHHGQGGIGAQIDCDQRAKYL